MPAKRQQQSKYFVVCLAVSGKVFFCAILGEEQRV
jgi:hypothetical protein